MWHEQVRYADFATLTTLQYYEKKVFTMTASTPTPSASARGRSTSNASVSSNSAGGGCAYGAGAASLAVPAPDMEDPDLTSEELWNREMFNFKRKELTDTRRMLNCVLQQLRDVDQSQMIAGVPITWNMLKAAAGVIGSIAAVWPSGR
jgi:hypothetical protein